MMLYVDFENKYNIPVNPLAGLILVSGVFDLVPLVETEININLKMDATIAKQNSPMMLQDIKCKNNLSILIAYAEFDSPAFKEQSEKYKKVISPLTCH